MLSSFATWTAIARHAPHLRQKAPFFIPVHKVDNGHDSNTHLPVIFWAIAALMALFVSVSLVRAVLSRQATAERPGAEAAAHDLRVYRDQLAEVERDLSRGLLSQADAERTRTEISRRILAADAAAGNRRTAGSGPSGKVLAGCVAIVLIAGSLALYSTLGQPGYGDLALADRIAFAEEVRQNRPDQAAAEAAMPPNPAPEGLAPTYLDLMEKLRTTVAERPDDLQGHLLLAQNEARIGNFAAAARAQEAVLRIKGAEGDLSDVEDYVELLIGAAGGYVSPEAETVLRSILGRDPESGTARYYIGLMFTQTGRPDLALRHWDRLLRNSPADAPWIEPIRLQIADVAELAGERYEIPEEARAPRPGPSAADIEAAGQMSPADRMEMIGSMVAGLSDRLATEGGPPADWARLITSLGVLDRGSEARAIYDNALEVFSGDPDALDQIRAAGAQAGVAE